MISGHCGHVATVEVKLKALIMEIHEGSFTPWDFCAKVVSRQTNVKMHMSEVHELILLAKEPVSEATLMTA